ncbi:MAG TPA: MarR family transcriptional regulator [Hyphomicrobiales bacterium]|nr:MarR family transcriptional regulator [Kaistiaceae bacterium]HQF31620.1 MarR family transcriptional regulator [Hyphomicrobiales bacterium]
MTEVPVPFRVFREIGIIDQLATTLLGRWLEDGLTVPQFALLDHLVRLGDDRNPSDLADAFQVTRGAMTNTLARLEARRFVELRPDARDGRAKRVFLTDAGRAVHDRAIARIGPGIAGLLADIPEAEFAAALPFLERLRKLLDSDDYRARAP